VGPSAAVLIPDGAKTLDMSGSTVIPGLIGMHDHLFYTGGGRACGTDVGTRGHGSTWARVSPRFAPRGAARRTRRSTSRTSSITATCRVRGIHLTAPYITGQQGGGADGDREFSGSGAPLRRVLGGRGRDMDQSVYRTFVAPSSAPRSRSATSAASKSRDICAR